MNTIFKILSIFVFCSLLVSCGEEDETQPIPLRDYAVQYADDLKAIDEYIDTHYMTVDASNFDVTFTKIPAGGTQQSIRTQTQYPLKDTLIAEDGIQYKTYFIKFREGDGVNGKRPTQVDSIHISYRGINLSDVQFDNATNPVWFGLQDVITGWSHLIPNFKTGTYTTAPGPNPITFNDFGAGVMFLPSGLAYYSDSAGSVTSYTPIIFSFKLYELRYRDHDRDGILSKDERNLDPAIPATLRWKENPLSNTFKYVGGQTLVEVPFLDTDGDGRPNMIDIDDDGDGVPTKIEITNPLTGTVFPFANIPLCTTPGSNGKKKHLDKACN